jgi:hypothetical protein
MKDTDLEEASITFRGRVQVKSKRLRLVFVIVIIAAMLVIACGGAAYAPAEGPSAEEPVAGEPVAEEPTEEGAQEPAAEEPTGSTGCLAAAFVPLLAAFAATGTHRSPLAKRDRPI